MPEWLIDTDRFTHMGKWAKLQQLWPRNTFFAQGNVTLIRKGVARCGVFALPKLDDLDSYCEDPHDQCTEAVPLECGLYFGDRNTEPRVAMVTHLVFKGQDEERRPKPQDVFVVNLHLTTLMKEREGVPLVDEQASKIRLRQLDIVLDSVVSRYNDWRNGDYYVRNVGPQAKQGDRLPPIWILSGDFNFTPESVEYQTLVRRAFIDMDPLEAVPGLGNLQLRDLCTKASGIGHKHPPTITLDYIFAGPRFAAVPPTIGDLRFVGTPHCTSARHSTQVSDHWPISVSLPVNISRLLLHRQPMRSEDERHRCKGYVVGQSVAGGIANTILTLCNGDLE